MARQTFTWSPDVGAKLKRKPAVRVAQFGDGYQQRSVLGINSNPRVWSVTFTVNGESLLLMEKFLEDHRGVHTFLWTDPRGRLGIYKCGEWDGASQGKGGVYSLTTTFEEVFE